MKKIMTVDEEAYDTWFRGKVQEAMDSTMSSKPHAEVMQRLRASIEA